MGYGEGRRLCGYERAVGRVDGVFLFFGGRRQTDVRGRVGGPTRVAAPRAHPQSVGVDDGAERMFSRARRLRASPTVASVGMAATSAGARLSGRLPLAEEPREAPPREHDLAPSKGRTPRGGSARRGGRGRGGARRASSARAARGGRLSTPCAARAWAPAPRSGRRASRRRRRCGGAPPASRRSEEDIPRARSRARRPSDGRAIARRGRARRAADAGPRPRPRPSSVATTTRPDDARGCFLYDETAPKLFSSSRKFLPETRRASVLYRDRRSIARSASARRSPLLAVDSRRRVSPLSKIDPHPEPPLLLAPRACALSTITPPPRSRPPPPARPSPRVPRALLARSSCSCSSSSSNAFPVESMGLRSCSKSSAVTASTMAWMSRVSLSTPMSPAKSLVSLYTSSRNV